MCHLRYGWTTTSLRAIANQILQAERKCARFREIAPATLGLLRHTPCYLQCLNAKLESNPRVIGVALNQKHIAVVTISVLTSITRDNQGGPDVFRPSEQASWSFHPLQMLLRHSPARGHRRLGFLHHVIPPAAKSDSRS